MTVYEFRREIEPGPEVSRIETLTVRADAADIAIIMTLVRDRLIADMPTPAQESVFQPFTSCVACGATFKLDPTAPMPSIKRCPECVRQGFMPLDGPS